MTYKDEKDIQAFKKVNTDSWDTVQDDIFVRLLNTKCIDKYGDDIAHTKVMDLSMAFSVNEVMGETFISHMLTNQEIEKYGVDLETVKKKAVLNSTHDRRKRIVSFKESILRTNPMYPLLRVPDMPMMMGSSQQNSGILEDVDEEGNPNLLMVMNTTNVFGASYAFLPSVLDELYERFDYSNFYLLPLSVHSILCVKSSYATKNGEKPIGEVEDDLLDLVLHMNDHNNKSWKDILSYRIYYFIGDDGKVVVPIK